LIVGERRGYKNAQLFFKAFEALGSARSRYDIVCTGSKEPLEEMFAAHVGPATVHMLQLSDDDLQAAYAGAQALVYPSKYEGFGMPVIEAMACECPVITSRNSSLQEVAGEAAIYVDPDDVRDMTRALKQLQDKTHRNRFIAAGRRRASLYSWRKMAVSVRTALTEIAARDAAPASIAVSREQALGSALQLHQSGQLEQAVAIYLRLLSADTNDFVALHLLGVARNQQGNTDEAVRLLERAISINQLTPEAHYNLGNAYLAKGRIADAHAAFGRALALNPQFELARNQLNALAQKH
jgi:tetratricopeptide (TPR) repeat protein